MSSPSGCWRSWSWCRAILPDGATRQRAAACAVRLLRTLHAREPVLLAGAVLPLWLSLLQQLTAPAAGGATLRLLEDSPLPPVERRLPVGTALAAFRDTVLGWLLCEEVLQLLVMSNAQLSAAVTCLGRLGRTGSRSAALRAVTSLVGERPASLRHRLLRARLLPPTPAPAEFTRLPPAAWRDAAVSRAASVTPPEQMALHMLMDATECMLQWPVDVEVQKLLVTMLSLPWLGAEVGWLDLQPTAGRPESAISATAHLCLQELARRSELPPSQLWLGHRAVVCAALAKHLLESGAPLARLGAAAAAWEWRSLATLLQVGRRHLLPPLVVAMATAGRADLLDDAVATLETSPMDLLIDNYQYVMSHLVLSGRRADLGKLHAFIEKATGKDIAGIRRCSLQGQAGGQPTLGELMDALLAACRDADNDARRLVAECLGSLGAIDPARLTTADKVVNSAQPVPLAPIASDDFATDCYLSLDQPHSALGLARALAARSDAWQEEFGELLVEATWRLGQWDALEPALEDTPLTSWGAAVGATLLHADQKKKTEFEKMLSFCREQEMAPLCLATIEKGSYAREYEHLVRLHILSDYGAARVSREAGQLQEAANCLLQMEPQERRLPEAFVERARLLWLRGDGDNAIRVLRQGVESHFPDWSANLKAGRLTTENRNILAEAKLLLARYCEESAHMDSSYGCRHVYESMPRLLSVWLDYGADVSNNKTNKRAVDAALVAKNMDMMCRRVGQLLQGLPLYCFLTSLPQIISRILPRPT
ncbi:Serine/threonine-protein kinase ATR [Amphibalanus amphitrite]|uniref:Serine/threonine-protein kinase ATR n=1 Tax=Amphibalanus amphitrite TaxID=1232801 RepID=A0A6A4WA03_AMPAM|nr:Serine/threonine-protein kinase ATR [Amphibalanus amphitrite]